MEQKAIAIRYLERLAPALPPSRISTTIEHLSNSKIEALVAVGAERLGLRLHETHGPLRALFEVPTVQAALELGEVPRIIYRDKGGQLNVYQHLRSRPVEQAELADLESKRFLIPTTRLHLDPIRNKKRMGRVWAYLLKERSLLQAVITYAVFVELLYLTIPLTIQVLINTISFGFVSQQLILLTLLLLGALMGAAALRVFQMVMLEHLSRRFMSHVFNDFSERLAPKNSKARQLQPVYRFFEVVAVDKAVFAFGLDILTLVLQLVAASLLLAFYHPTLLAFTIVMVLSSWLVLRLPFDRGVDASLAESNAKYALAEYLEGDHLNEVGRVARVGTWMEARRQGFRVSLGQQIGLLAVQVLLSTALLLIGGRLVLQGELTLGQLVAAELVAGTALMSLNKIGKQLPKIYDLVTSFEKLGKLVDLPLDEPGESKAES